jgi:hypothetical protein
MQFAFYSHLSLMGLDNGLGNGQSQPAALGLGGIEGLKDLIDAVGGIPSPLSLIRNHPVDPGRWQRLIPRRHRLHAIFGDIQKHLAQQERVKLNLRKVGVQMHRQRYAVFLEARFQLEAHFPDQGVEINGALSGLR